jgi:hypothetical protein
MKIVVCDAGWVIVPDMVKKEVTAGRVTVDAGA